MQQHNSHHSRQQYSLQVASHCFCFSLASSVLLYQSCCLFSYSLLLFSIILPCFTHPSHFLYLFPLLIIFPLFSSLQPLFSPLFNLSSFIMFSSVFTCYACTTMFAYNPSIAKSQSLTQIHQSTLSSDKIHFSRKGKIKEVN